MVFHLFIARTSHIVYLNLSMHFIIFYNPKTPEAWKEVARKYNELWNSPNCIGVVDGNHVAMVAPPNAPVLLWTHTYTPH